MVGRDSHLSDHLAFQTRIKDTYPSISHPTRKVFSQISVVLVRPMTRYISLHRIIFQTFVRGDIISWMTMVLD